MALQVLVDKVSVVSAGEVFDDKMFTGTVRLRCWPSGASVPGDPTIIDEEIGGLYKDVEGLTVDQQLTRWVKIVKAYCQQIIDSYILEKALFDSAKLDTAVAAIQSGLSGG